MPPHPRAMAVRPASISYICDSCARHSIPSPLVRVFSSSTSTSSSSSKPSNNPRRTSFSARVLVRDNTTLFNLPVRNSTTLRAYSTETTSQSTQLQPANAGIVSLRHRRLVSLTGAEAAKFLQGLITNDVDPKSYRPFYSAFLDARGRMLWDIFVWPQESETKEWGCLIEVDGGEAEGLMKHLKRHKLRSKIVIKLVEDEGESGITVCAGWGKEKEIEAFLESQRNSEPSGGHSIVAAMPDPRAGEAPESLPFAHRFLVQGTETEIPTTSSLPLLDPKQYTLRRYLFGVPEGPAEIPRENALPMENNIDLAGGINFKKGCYVGQELTIRTKHTGVVRKRVLPVQLYHTFEREPEGFNAEERALAQRLGVPLPRFDPDWTAGTEIEVPLDIKQVEENDDDEGVSFKKGRTRGKLIARVGNVGLAMCRLENMTAMKVSAEGGSYTPETRFGVQTGREGEERVLLVKAFLPHWLVQRERELWSRSKARAGQSA